MGELKKGRRIWKETENALVKFGEEKLGMDGLAGFNVVVGEIAFAAAAYASGGGLGTFLMGTAANLALPRFFKWLSGPKNPGKNRELQLTSQLLLNQALTTGILFNWGAEIGLLGAFLLILAGSVPAKRFNHEVVEGGQPLSVLESIQVLVTMEIS